ncbi:MAG: hypothetical protein JMN27_03195 [gamma proteobacterium endosymbiont of Lamellibrachia anaximandri]|nr:hypothetical protein [gamma proteobacterium endosymbiont of Lamellibrachia anaximandri]MBL3532821.1 hypothetical protein [gamma proteobacterium endosymbiont of Lamellibrachia anaximandri]
MKKPANEDFSLALEAAHGLLGGEDTGDAVGRCLLYLEHRNEQLERLVELAERYFRFGQPEEDHARIVRLLESIREETRDEEETDNGEFGLE